MNYWKNSFYIIMCLIIFGCSGVHEQIVEEQNFIANVYQEGLDSAKKGLYNVAENKLYQVYDYYSRYNDIDMLIQIMFELTETYMYQSKYNEANNIIQKIKLYNSNANNKETELKVIVAEGKLYFSKENESESINLFKKCINTAGSYNMNNYILLGYNGLLLNYLRLNDKNNMKKSVNKILSLLSGQKVDADVYFNLGQYYKKIGKYSDAKNYFQQALKLDAETGNKYQLKNDYFSLYRIEKETGGSAEKYYYNRYKDLE